MSKRRDAHGRPRRPARGGRLGLGIVLGVVALGALWLTKSPEAVPVVLAPIVLMLNAKR